LLSINMDGSSKPKPIRRSDEHLNVPHNTPAFLNLASSASVRTHLSRPLIPSIIEVPEGDAFPESLGAEVEVSIGENSDSSDAEYVPDAATAAAVEAAADAAQDGGEPDVADLASLLASSGLASALQERLESLVGADSGYVDSLPEEAQARLAYLRELEAEREGLILRRQRLLSELEARCAADMNEYYAKRGAVVAGTLALPEAPGATPKPVALPADAAPAVPDFWVTVFRQADVEFVHEVDYPLLEFLENMTSNYLAPNWGGLESDDEDPTNGPGFEICLTFRANPYFSNRVLKRVYRFDLEDPDLLQHFESSDIEWLPGKDVTHAITTGTVRNPRGSRKVRKAADVESFFRWFAPPSPADMQRAQAAQSRGDNSLVERIEEQLDLDMTIANTLRREIIPKAVLLFHGELQAAS
jgi:nucleosome assembly protein 1-like 1